MAIVNAICAQAVELVNRVLVLVWSRRMWNYVNAI